MSGAKGVQPLLSDRKDELVPGLKDGSRSTMSVGSDLSHHDSLHRAPAKWPEIPGYSILAEVGRGGMGTVFKALQQRLDRVVALKVIRQENLSKDPDAVRRFEREARASAKLSHPNLVTVHDFDQVGDTCFIAMEYVDGIDLYQLIRNSEPLPVREATNYILQAGLGLQHAYECGMVHRDIKPSNLLVVRRHSPTRTDTSTDNSSVLFPAARVKIVDFGMACLVHRTESESVNWAQGGLMGTPDFIAPEQALNFHLVDIRSDLYSLGCTFYFLLTGRPPFGDCPLMKKLLMHQTAKPRPIGELRPEVPAAIEGIVNQLLAKRPEDRFPTPVDLVEALSLLSLTDMPAGRVASSEPEAAQDSSALSIFFGPSKRTELISAPVFERTRKEDEPERASGLEQPEKIAVLKGHKNCVTALAFSPNRYILAAASVGGALGFWKLDNGGPREMVMLETVLTEVHALAFSPDSRFVACGSGSLDGLVGLTDLTPPLPNKMIPLQGHKGPVNSVAFSPDGRRLASGGSDKTIHLWELTEAGLHEQAAFQGHEDHIKAVAFAPDNQTLASGSLDGTVRIWRKNGFWSKDLVARFQGEFGPVHSVAPCPDGRLLAFGSLDQSVRLCELAGADSHSMIVLKGHVGVVRAVLFSPDGNRLVSVCDGGRIILWSISSTRKLRQWQLSRTHVYSVVALTADGRYLAAGTTNGNVYVYRLYRHSDTPLDLPDEH